MDLPATFFALGTIPYFTSRLFAPAFWLAVWANLQEHGGLEYFYTDWWIFQWRFTLEYPEWFAAPETVFMLFLLAVIESMADKSPDAAYFMALVDSEAKALGNFVFNSGITISSSLALAAAGTVTTFAVTQAGIGSLSLAGVVGGGVWMFAKMRASIAEFFRESDEDDALGLRKLFSWAEDGWVGIGTFMLVVLPVLSLLISGLALLALFLVQLYLKAKEEKQKIACPNCGERNYSAGIQCFSCRQPMPSPVQLGFLSQPGRHPAIELDQQRLDLLSRRRCLSCATRLPEKSLRQTCPACQTEVFPSSAWVDAYLKHVKDKLPKTLLICLGFSLIPVLGLIPGIIYYRAGLISKLRAYIPRGTGCLVQGFVRIVNIFLLTLQWIPLLGAVTLPLMCLINYFIYLRSVQEQKTFTFRGGESELRRLDSSVSPQE